MGRLVDRRVEAGCHTVHFVASNLLSGVYFTLPGRQWLHADPADDVVEVIAR